MRRFWITLNILYEKIMLFVFVIALLIVCYGLYDTWYVYNKAGDDGYLKFKPVAGSGMADDSPITEDMVAWITIDGTNIDYPLMHAAANMKFLDSRNSADFSDEYSILYGHHMEYGVMFGALDEFLDEKYMKNHSKGTLIVGRDGSVSYELGVFACMKVNEYDKKMLDPDSLENISALISEEASVINTSIKNSDHIMVLSTCTEPVSTNRLLVFCYIYE